MLYYEDLFNRVYPLLLFMKKSLASFVFLAFLLSPLSLVLAQTTPTSTITAVSSSTTDILAEIQKLLALITSLQTQLDTLKAEQTKVTQELGRDTQTTVPPPSSGVVFSSTTLPPPAPIFTRTLNRGASGSDVRELQLFLKSLPGIYPEGLLTSFYGPLTEKAVKRFQAEYGIADSGTATTTGYGSVGEKTQAKIRELMTEGAGRSGNIPPGLLSAPGIQKKLATTSIPVFTPTLTPAGTLPAQPIGQTGTTTIPAIPRQPNAATTQTGITILSPNGGEQWIKGTTYSITWYNPLLTGFPGDKNFSWRVTVEGTDGRFSYVGTVPVSNSSIPWTIPLSLPDSGTAYKARVALERRCFSVPCPSFFDLLHTSPFEDTSDSPFGIYALAVAPLPPPVSLPPALTPTLTPTFPSTLVQTSPVPGQQKWVARFDGFVGAPVVGSDGTVYFTVQKGTGSPSKLYAYTPGGTQKWVVDSGSALREIALGKDDTIFVGADDYKIYAFSRDGIQKWVFTTDGPLYNVAALGTDDTVYVGTVRPGKRIYALDPTTGSKKWEFVAGDGFNSSPVVGSDGTIYAASQDFKLYALDPAAGTRKWFYYVASAMNASPAIGSDSTIYIGANDKKIYAIGRNGELKWHFTTESQIHSAPAVGPDGTIYIGADRLYAIYPNGVKKWSYDAYVAVGAYETPAVGADGIVYVATLDKKFLALNPDGTLKWVFNTGYENLTSSPAIVADGTLYVASFGYYKLYALYSTSLGLANSSWPKAYKNNRNSGNINENNNVSSSYLFTPMSVSTPPPAPAPTPSPIPTPPPTSPPPSVTATTTTGVTAPSIPTNLTATVVSSAQANLSWSSSVGAIGYKIYRDENLIASIAATTASTASYQATSLLAGTFYNFAVAACDTTGNICSQTTSPISVLTAATLSLPDLYVTNLVVASSLIAAGRSTYVTATVLNMGTAPAVASRLLLTEMNTPLFNTNVSVPALGVGQSASVSSPIGTVPNVATTYRWSAKADWTNVITESNEDNNVSSEITVDTYASSTSVYFPSNTHNNLAAISQALNVIKEQLLELLQELSSS